MARLGIVLFVEGGSLGSVGPFGLFLRRARLGEGTAVKARWCVVYFGAGSCVLAGMARQHESFLLWKLWQVRRGCARPVLSLHIPAAPGRCAGAGCRWSRRRSAVSGAAVFVGLDLVGQIVHGIIRQGRRGIHGKAEQLSSLLDSAVTARRLPASPGPELPIRYGFMAGWPGHGIFGRGPSRPGLAVPGTAVQARHSM